MRKKRFIDDYAVILLDMGNAFMFGCDRFGPNIDYYSLYQELGGGSLSESIVSKIIKELSITHSFLRIPELRCLLTE